MSELWFVWLLWNKWFDYYSIKNSPNYYYNYIKNLWPQDCLIYTITIKQSPSNFTIYMVLKLFIVDESQERNFYLFLLSNKGHGLLNLRVLYFQPLRTITCWLIVWVQWDVLFSWYWQRVSTNHYGYNYRVTCKMSFKTRHRWVLFLLSKDFLFFFIWYHWYC